MTNNGGADKIGVGAALRMTERGLQRETSRVPRLLIHPPSGSRLGGEFMLRSNNPSHKLFFKKIISDKMIFDHLIITLIFILNLSSIVSLNPYYYFFIFNVNFQIILTFNLISSKFFTNVFNLNLVDMNQHLFNMNQRT